MSDASGSEERTAGFRLLYRPTPQLAKSNAEIAFVVEKPRSAYRFDIWTRAGYRTGEDAASLETWQSVFEPHSQRVEVPDWFAGYVRSVWERGGTDEEICLALQDVYETLQEAHEVEPTRGTLASTREIVVEVQKTCLRGSKEPPSEQEVLTVIGRQTAGGQCR